VPPPEQPLAQPAPGNPRGQIRRQEAGRTQPRPPSLAEQRARQVAEQEQREAMLATEAAAARKAKKRKRLLIGGGVTVGVVGLVAIGYAVLSPSNVQASCTSNDVVVDNDDFCNESYVTSHGGHVTNGIMFLPLPGGGYSQYRYNYGGTGTVGQKVSGGSYTIPKGANVSTKSGTSIQRGGFGVSSGSSKSGTSGGS
jgi:hypothetical protein